MDYFPSEPAYTNLSLIDLLEARDQFHVHLMHKANVVGTAIGKYLIRKTDPRPSDLSSVKPTEGRSSKTPKPPRTLENAELRDYSWPCVIVLVSDWAHQDEFVGGDLLPSDFVPKTIYTKTKAVPICVVLAPLWQTPAPPVDPFALKYPDLALSGGYPIKTTVQKMDHVASIGCLVTDGHTVYALTNRHVSGKAGECLSSVLANKPVKVGVSSDKQLGRVSFERLYPGWPGENVYANVDVGLVELDDLTQWSPSVYGLGRLGPLRDLDATNLTVDLIGCPVRAYGCASGRLSGRIAALFYRYKSVGGFEYVADFLIGSMTDEPLRTRPGDSGSIWVVDTQEPDRDLMPIAVQWGGTVFSGNTSTLPFALASNLSGICRELDVELFRARGRDSFDYWGAVGHYTIGSFACGQVRDGKLKAFLLANRDRISFDPSSLNTSVNDVNPPGFVQLADVPDKVWKKVRAQATPYGRRGPENPNHYADMDYAPPGGKSLEELTPTDTSLNPQTWRTYYDGIGWKTISQRGLLPFRVWQIYKKMVDFLQKSDLASFLAACGVLAHYVGDACQPLHGSYLDDGDPFRNPDGTASPTMLGHAKGYAHGVHVAYEDGMLDANVDEILSGLPAALGSNHGMELVQGGQNAGYNTVKLMSRSRITIAPIKLVNAYGQILEAGKKGTASDLLWQSFKTDTIAVLADGSNTLAMVWECAWVEGSGTQIAADKLKAISPGALQALYESQDFLPSVPLDEIDQYL
jgi:hypothetical protein